MIEILCASIAAYVVGIVVLTAIVGWGHRVTRCQRVGLLLMAAGLVLAAPQIYQRGVGLADLIFLSGMATYLTARNLKFILRHADAIDGVEDGRLSLPATTHELMARIRHVSGNQASRR